MQLDLSELRFLVLDEADKLFEGGFLEQIDAVFAEATHSDLCRCLFSATLPEVVEQTARSILQDPIRITVGERNSAAHSVDQKLIFVGQVLQLAPDSTACDLLCNLWICWAFPGSGTLRCFIEWIVRQSLDLLGILWIRRSAMFHRVDRSMNAGAIATTGYLYSLRMVCCGLLQPLAAFCRGCVLRPACRPSSNWHTE